MFIVMTTLMFRLTSDSVKSFLCEYNMTQLTIKSFGSDDKSSNKGQSITWANYGLVHWRILLTCRDPSEYGLS